MAVASAVVQSLQIGQLKSSVVGLLSTVIFLEVLMVTVTDSFSPPPPGLAREGVSSQH
jgi:hypothetical protein